MASDGSSSKSMQHAAHDSTLSVGSASEAGSNKVRELEEEVRHLAEKANSASQRFADYENEIRVLQARVRQHERRVTTPQSPSPSSPGGGETSPPSQLQRLGISRFPSFMQSRKPVAESPITNGDDPVVREKQLEESLAKEQTLRAAAESKVKEVNAEIEELSVSLFQQANEMVAHERKESARLKQRIKVLEEHGVPENMDATQKENVRLREKIRSLEQRDIERRKRLERLEAANRRIERVRAMLIPR